MSPEYCAWGVNFDPEAQFLKIRSGYQIHAILPSTIDAVVQLGVYNNASLFAYCYNNSGSFFHQIYNVTTSTPSLAHTTGAFTAVSVGEARYAGKLAFITSANAVNTARVYDGSSWSAFGFTYLGTVLTVQVAITYKNRVFFTTSSDGYVYVGAVGGVTGAADRHDFTTLFEGLPQIAWMGVLTSPSNNSDEQYICFGSFKGEILVYAGDHPNASNWEQVARFNKTSPILFQWSKMAIQVRNDIYVVTENGLLSVRSQFQNFEDPEDYYISKNISPYWREFFLNYKQDSGSAYMGPSMAYWPEQNKLYILMCGFLDNDGTYTSSATAASMFVYNLTSKAWQVHKLPCTASTNQSMLGNLVYMNNNIYFSINKNIMSVESASFKDETPDDVGGTFTAYDTKLHSAYQNYSRSEKYKKVEGFDLIINTDFTGSQIGMKAAADMGRKVSQQSTQDFRPGYSNPFYSVGVDGNFVQWRIEGTSDTAADEGFELHSVGASVT